MSESTRSAVIGFLTVGSMGGIVLHEGIRQHDWFEIIMGTIFIAMSAGAFVGAAAMSFIEPKKKAGPQ